MITPYSTLAQPRRRPDESGNVLVVVYITLVPVIGLIAAFFGRSATEMTSWNSHKAAAHSELRALAALEVARNRTINSTYSGGSNDFLAAALGNTGVATLRPGGDLFGTGYVGFDITTGQKVMITSDTGLPPNIRPYRQLLTVDMEDEVDGEFDDVEDKVTVWVASLQDLWYVFEAQARVGGIVRTARVLARERDPFTRFSVFIDSHFQGIGGSPKGDIHTNRKLQFFFPNGNFDDYTSARDGFQWMIGANWGNTQFNSGYSESSPQIPMPKLMEIQTLKSLASGPFLIPNTHDRVEVEFLDTDVRIRARQISTGATVELHNGPLPANGIIYAEREITSIKGDINGRTTVVSESTVTITDSLRYVDDEGDAVMDATQGASGYTQNPDYNGNSALGIIGNGSVLYDKNIPNNMEINAAIFSATGMVGIPGLGFTSEGAYVNRWDATFQKNDLMVLGSTLADKRFVGTVVTGGGTVLSGFQDAAIEYDRALLNNPPPYFLDLQRPLFKAVEILENLVDL